MGLLILWFEMPPLQSPKETAIVLYLTIGISVVVILHLVPDAGSSNKFRLYITGCVMKVLQSKHVGKEIDIHLASSLKCSFDFFVRNTNVFTDQQWTPVILNVFKTAVCAFWFEKFDENYLPKQSVWLGRSLEAQYQNAWNQFFSRFHLTRNPKYSTRLEQQHVASFFLVTLHRQNWAVIEGADEFVDTPQFTCILPLTIVETCKTQSTNPKVFKYCSWASQIVFDSSFSSYWRSSMVWTVFINFPLLILRAKHS